MSKLLYTALNQTGRKLKTGELVSWYMENGTVYIKDYDGGRNFSVVEEMSINGEVVIIAWQGDSYLLAEKDCTMGEIIIAFPIETKKYSFQRQLIVYDNCKKGDLVPICIRTRDMNYNYGYA